MTNEQIEELQKLAEAATPGVWLHGIDYTDNGEVSHHYVITSQGDFVINADDAGPAERDAAYIAAANPAAIKEVLSELTTLRAVLAAAPKAELTDERAAFEAAVRELTGWDTAELVRHRDGYLWKPVDEMWRIWEARAVLAQAAPVAEVPVGYVLVPEKITEPMHVAAVRAVLKATGNDDLPPSVWAAMLAAAPAAPVSAAVPAGELVPKWAGQFDTHQQWVNKGRSWLASPSHAPAVCIDAKGRRCTIGADMARARDEGAFPVRYFWECEVSAAPAPGEAS